MNAKHIIQIFSGLFFCFQLTALGQDSVTINDLKPYSYDFKLENENFKGAGAKILKEAISNSHITLVGNSRNSKLQNDFSNALLSVLDSNDYKKFVIEEGAISGKIINKLAKTPETVKQFADLNNKYSFQRLGSIIPPIHSLKSVEAAEFIQNAEKRDWTIFPIGLESWNSYKMVVDELYNNIPKNNQDGNISALHKKTLVILDDGYQEMAELDNENCLIFMTALTTSETFISFLQAMEEFEANKELVYYFRKSLDYWTLFGKRDYAGKNKISIEESSERMAKLLQSDSFDFQSEKLFVNMSMVHLGKGIAANGYYGAGSMLNEMTGFYGNTCLSIGMIPRFYKKDGKVEDYLESDVYFLQIFKELLMPLGKKENWVLIDLRSFTQDLIYGPFIVNSGLRNLIARYDMLIIPSTDRDATMNY